MAEDIKDETEKTRENRRELYLGPDGKFKEGNPGKPPGTLSLKTKIIHALEKYSEEKGKTLAEVFAEVGIQKALDGDHNFWKTIISYVDGMPKESIEHSGKIENILSEEQINELLSHRANSTNASGEI